MDSCFVCLEQADDEHPYTDIVCKCKGSLHLHTACYTRLRGLHAKCPNCKTAYPDTDVEYDGGLPVKVSTDADGLIHRYTQDENNQPHGYYTVYYPYGKLAAKCTYEHGVPTLIARRWNMNGVLVERCTYLGGKLHSYYYRWGDTGELLDVRTYYNGEMSGRHYIFTGGKTAKIQMYVDGRPCGNYKICDVFELPTRVCVNWKDAETNDLLR